MRTIFLIILLALFAGSIVFFGFVAFRSSAEQTEENASSKQETLPLLREPTITFIDPVRGNTSAMITIVEFGDYFCQFCKEMEPVVSAVLAAYPDQARLVWKDLPNDKLHTEASKAAGAARCAGEQGKFWEYHDMLLKRAAPGVPLAFGDIAASIGIDRTAFQLCLDSDRLRPRVIHSIGEAERLGVSGTPSFFINGKPFSGTSFEEFTSAIDRLVVIE